MAVKKTKTAKPKPKFKLTLTLGDLVFKSEGDVFSEVVEKIYSDSFGKIKTWGVLTLETEGKRAEIRYRPIQIKRSFNRFGRELLEKRLLMVAK